LQLIGRHDGDSRLDLVFGIKTMDIEGAEHGKKEEKETKEEEGKTPEKEEKKSPTLQALVDELYAPHLPIDLRGQVTASELVRLLIRKRPVDGEKDAYADKERLFESCDQFRLKVCQDMIGNTICADILDYLYRDWYHVGKPRPVDERLLQYMQIRTPREQITPSGKPAPTSRDMFVVSLGDRPKIRTDAVSEILGLLEWRYQLAESVLFHRTKLAASAMLERALYELWGAGKSENLERTLLRFSDEALLPWCYQQATKENSEEAKAARRLLLDLMERRIVVELDTCFHEEKAGDFTRRIENKYGKGPKAAENRWAAVRGLEEDFGLERGSLVMYCPTRDMNAKIAEVKIYCNDDVQPFNKYEKDNHELSGGHLEAQEMRFHRLWRVHFFIAEKERESVKKRGLLDRLITACRYFVLEDMPRGVDPIELVREYAMALSGKGMPHEGKQVRAEATIASRTDPTIAYPTGIPSIRSFLEKKQ